MNCFFKTNDRYNLSCIATWPSVLNNALLTYLCIYSVLEANILTAASLIIQGQQYTGNEWTQFSICAISFYVLHAYTNAFQLWF